MALRFMDSFDHYASADIGKKYPQGTIGGVGDGPAIDGTAGRFTNGMHMQYSNVTPGANTHTSRVIDGMSHATAIAGFAFRWVTRTENDETVFAFKEGTTRHIELRLSSANALAVYRGGTSLGVGSAALSPNVWYYIELKVVIDDTTGSAVLRVDETEVATFNGDTRNGGSGVVNAIQLGPDASSSIPGTLDYHIDDLYVCDGSGGVNDDFLGDMRVQAIFPNANGNSSQLVGSDGNSTDNYLLVDETTPSTADYVQSSTPGDKDTYNYGSVTPVSGAVVGVQIVPYVGKTDAGSRTLTTVARSGGSETDGANVTLSTTNLYAPQVRETKPGGGAWTISDVNAAEFGVKVTT